MLVFFLKLFTTFQGGAFFGVIIGTFFSERFGRRWTIGGSGIVFIIGIILSDYWKAWSALRWSCYEWPRCRWLLRSSTNIYFGMCPSTNLWSSGWYLRKHVADCACLWFLGKLWREKGHSWNEAPPIAYPCLHSVHPIWPARPLTSISDRIPKIARLTRS